MDTYEGLTNIRYAFLVTSLLWNLTHATGCRAAQPVTYFGSQSRSEGNPSYTEVVAWYPKRQQQCVLSFSFPFLLRLTNFRLVKEAIVFSKKGNMGNLSRIDPAMVSTGGGVPYFFSLPSGGLKFMMFTSVGVVGACNIKEPYAMGSQGRIRKQITLSLFGGEHERLVGAIGMVTNQPQYGFPISGDFIEFSTTVGDMSMYFLSLLCSFADRHRSRYIRLADETRQGHPR